MGSDEARRLQMLEKENVRLKKIVADQALDIAILKDVNSKNSKPGQAQSICSIRYECP